MTDVETTAETALRVQTVADTPGDTPEIYPWLLPQLVQAHDDLWENHYSAPLKTDDGVKTHIERFRAVMRSFDRALKSRLSDPDLTPKAAGELTSMKRTAWPQGLKFLQYERSRMFMAAHRAASIIEARYRSVLVAHDLNAPYDKVSAAHRAMGEAMDILEIQEKSEHESTQVKFSRLRNILSMYILQTVAWASLDPSREPRADFLLSPFTRLRNAKRQRSSNPSASLPKTR